MARVLPIAGKEVRDALTNRWLIAYAVLLGGLGLAATATGLDSASGLAIQAFGRTTATLMNLCLLLSPLVAVVMGAAVIAGEQERGTLEHLLAQPLTRSELLLGKHAGLLAALTAATAAGFVPAGLAIALAAGPGVLGHYLLFPTIAVLAGAAMAAVGVLISVTSRSAVHAQGMAMVTWFGFVLLYDLVLMGSLALSGMPAQWLAAALVSNPVDAARVLGVLALEPDLYLLGPAGSFLTTWASPRGAAGLLLGAITLWAVLPVWTATMKFSIRRRLDSYAKNKTRFGAVGRYARRGDRVRRVADVQG
jgi:Cu-processing system permease protein